MNVVLIRVLMGVGCVGVLDYMGPPVIHLAAHGGGEWTDDVVGHVLSLLSPPVTHFCPPITRIWGKGEGSYPGFLLLQCIAP